MSLVSLEVKPNAATSLEVASPASAVSVDIGPAIVQSVAVEDANGQYAVELSMVAMGPEGPEGKPGRVIDVLGTFGLSKTPADLPSTGLIPVGWDTDGSPRKSTQFSVGDALVYQPQDTTDISYGHVFAFTGDTYATPWMDCGALRGEKGEKGDTGDIGATGATGATGPSNVLSIGNVVTGTTASASLTGTSPKQTLNLVLPKGDTGADGHTPIVDMSGDQVMVDGVVVGPHLTGPQGPQGETGRSLTILGYYASEADLRTAHPIGQLGDCYLIGSGYLYVWGATGWANVGQLQGPKGDPGTPGATGPANSLSVGSVTSGSSPSVTIRGTSPNQILDFVLQQGPKGDTGSTGATGNQGPIGPSGPANSLSIGSVIAGATASASIEGSPPNQTLSLVLPKGDTGAQGPAGPAGKDGSAFESGTRMLFAQASAPLGWTRVTDDTADNRMLRVVATGGGDVGGSNNPTLMNVVPSHTHSFTTGGQSASHSHSGSTGAMSANASHTHTITDNGHTHTFQFVNKSSNGSYATSGGTGMDNPVWQQGTTVSAKAGVTNVATNTDHTHSFSTGAASGDHTHSGTVGANSGAADWAPRYLSLILCSKD